MILNQSEATPRYESADGEPDRKQTRALIRDELNDLSRCCSQGTANSEFALTSCDASDTTMNASAVTRRRSEHAPPREFGKSR